MDIPPDSASAASTTGGLPVSPSLGPAIEQLHLPHATEENRARIVYVSLLAIGAAIAAAFAAEVLVGVIALVTNLAFYGRVSFEAVSPAHNRLGLGVIAVPVLKERLGAGRVAGFALGVAGVALIVNLGPIALDLRTFLGTLVAVAGAGFWGWAGVMIKQRAGKLPPMGLAAGSIAFSAILMAPLWAAAPPPATWTTPALLSLIGVGVVCSGLAYLPFFTLVRDIGPSRTLTVGLAVPVLGVLWGWLLLDEAVTAGMLAGAALVIVALALVLRR